MPTLVGSVSDKKNSELLLRIIHVIRQLHMACNCIGGVMVNMLTQSGFDHGFMSQTDQTKHYKIGICCLSTIQAALSSKSKHWLAQNQDNVSERSHMSTSGLLFQ